jgi:hypothetical protein
LKIGTISTRKSMTVSFQPSRSEIKNAVKTTVKSLRWAEHLGGKPENKPCKSNHFPKRVGPIDDAGLIINGRDHKALLFLP